MGTPLPIEQASVGMADSIILMILALVVFGPRKLPQIGRQIGKLMYEFRKASNDFKFQMEEELRMSEEAERKQKEEAQRQQTLAAQSVSAPALAAPLEDPTVEKMPEVQPPRMSAI
jgi:sec-independent protein translocase protein TatB